MIPTPCDDPLAIRGKDCGADLSVVPCEGEQFLARGCVPNPCRTVIAAGDNPLAVRGKGHRIDLSLVPSELEQLLTGGCVPDPCRQVVTARDNPPTVWRERG